MPWYHVIIAQSDIADATVTVLLNRFERSLRGVFAAAENPRDVAIYHGLDASGSHVYFFSPTAAAIAIRYGLFGGHNVTPYPGSPNLSGFKQVQGLTEPQGNRIRALVMTKEGWGSETEVSDPPPEIIGDTVFSDVPEYHGGPIPLLKQCTGTFKLTGWRGKTPYYEQV